MARVSIIIPVFNVEQYIESCLVSVLEQTNQDIEIILVDDCGTDKSMEIVCNIIKSHPNGNKSRIILHEKNRGLSAARNTGIEASIGEYLYFLDSDDEISLNTIEIMIRQVDKYHNPDFVIGGYCLLGEQINTPKLQLENGFIEGNDVIISSFVSRNWYVMAWNKLVKRSFLIKNSLFFEEGLLHEDILWSFKLACTANSMIVVNDTTYKYRIRENSIIHDNAGKLLVHFFRNIDLASQYVHNHSKINALTCEYLESLKFYAFLKKIELRSTTADRKTAYIFYKKCWNYFSVGPIPFKLKFKTSHYLLPTFIGFYLYQCYVKGTHMKQSFFGV